MPHEATSTTAVLPVAQPFRSADQHISTATPLPPQDPAAQPPADGAAGVVRAAGVVCAAAGALIAVCATGEPVKLTAGNPVFAGDVIITRTGGHAMIAFADGGTFAINGEVSAEIVSGGAHKARLLASGGAPDLTAGEAEAAGPAPLLISVKEACKLTGLSRSFLYELMAAGEIPFVHVGKRRLIPFAPLRGWTGRLVSAVKGDTIRAAKSGGRPPPGCGSSPPRSTRLDSPPQPRDAAATQDRRPEPLTSLGGGSHARPA